MLSLATLTVAERLAELLMDLAEAVLRASGCTPAFVGNTAHTLALRLTRLFTAIARITVCGGHAKPRRRPDAEPPPASSSAPRTNRPQPYASLPRRPGWILAALPDLAPSLAADLGALLADPNLAALLEQSSTLRRMLRPVLRGLGLIAPEAPPSAPPNPPSTPAPRPPTPPSHLSPHHPDPAPRPTASPPTKNRRHSRNFLTPKLLR